MTFIEGLGKLESPEIAHIYNLHTVGLRIAHHLFAGGQLPFVASDAPETTAKSAHNCSRHKFGKYLQRWGNHVGAGIHTQSKERIYAWISFQLRSLVFIFTTTVWTASSLLPYRVFVLVQYNLLDTMWADRCGWLPIWMSQLGWLLHYLLKLNPVLISFKFLTFHSINRL